MVVLVDVCLPERFLEQMGQKCTGSAMDSPISNRRLTSNEPVSEMSPLCCYVLGRS